MLSERTWVYWVGLLIVAFSIAGLIRGLVAIAFPFPHLPEMERVARLAVLATRTGLVRLMGSLVFLGVGVYMMKYGEVKQ